MALSPTLGRYELKRLLGRGGMAEVYLARRRAGGVEKQLVIKRIRRERAGDPRFLEMFLNEARLSMSLSHQNVVPVFDFGRLGDDVFLAMEYVEGRDLASTLARAGGPMPPLLAAHVASECCRGLAYAHRRIGADGTPLHIVHRDVTPRNVLLSWSGEVKLTDFGIAALAGVADERVRGTWAYMAPEQARAEVVDPRSDLYALGLVLWEMLAGKRARRGVDAAALAAEARSGELPPLPDAPPALADIVRRATATDPALRFADADALLAALDTYLVAARAASPGAAPGRQLADWLAAIWSEQAGLPAGDATDITVVIGDDEDGATLRSMAETAAEAEPAPVEVPRSSPPVRRVRILGLVVAVGAAAAAVYAFGRTRTRETAATVEPVVAEIPAADAAVIPEHDAASVADAPWPSPIDAMSASPGPDRPKPGRPDAGQADSAPKRDVTIGAVPWADFTIDGDAAVHQTPETVRLSPGRHQVTFRNPPLGIERTVTIEVPADRDVRHVEHLAEP